MSESHLDPITVPHSVFWADFIKTRRNRPNDRLAIARQHFPLPAAFREAAIALRALIRARRKAGEPFEDILEEFYRTAAQSDLLLHTPYLGSLIGPGFNVAQSIPRGMWEALEMPYPAIGHEELPILNKTDRKWIVEAWGEPRSHLSAQDYHATFWNAAVSTYRSKARASRAAFEQRMQELIAESTGQSSRGCLSSVVGLVGSLIALALLLLDA